MNKNKKILVVIIHVAAWACFFSLPYIFFPKPKDLPLEISNHILIQSISTNVFLVGFYYLNTLVLIPRLLFNKRWVWYIWSILACFIAFSFIPREIANLIIPPEDFREAMSQRIHSIANNPGNGKPGPPSFRHWRGNGGSGAGGWRWWIFPFFQGSYAIFLFVFTIGTCICVMQQWLTTEQTRKAVETEKLNTELSFLKSQVNPHFFFNTLNNIYSLAVVGSPQTPSAIMRLSSIMRYILTDTQSDLVPLENEISFIRNYIDLQLVRLTDKVKVEFTTEGDISSKQIAPLLFISFIENAFKYGVSTKEHSEISIHLATTDDTISFTSVNNIVKTDNGIHETTGIGINNVKRRLQLLYPGKHTLVVAESGNTFTVQLDILLK